MACQLKRTLVGEMMIGEAAGDFFHEWFVKKPHQIHSTVNDEFLQGCDLHEGEFGVPGSIIEWTYTVDGKQKTVKQRIEVVDEENRLMRRKCIGGDLTNDYDDFYSTFQVFPIDEEHCKVVWTFEYVKKRAGLPEPSAELDALLNMAKEIDDHHHPPKE